MVLATNPGSFGSQPQETDMDQKPSLLPVWVGVLGSLEETIQDLHQAAFEWPERGKGKCHWPWVKTPYPQ